MEKEALPSGNPVSSNLAAPPPAADLPPEGPALEPLENLHFAAAEPLPESIRSDQQPPAAPTLAERAAPATDLPAPIQPDSLPNLAFAQSPLPVRREEVPAESLRSPALAVSESPVVSGKNRSGVAPPESRVNAAAPPRKDHPNPSPQIPPENATPLPDEYVSLASPVEPVPGEYPGGPGGEPTRVNPPGANAHGSGRFVPYGVPIGILLILIAGILGYLLSRKKRK